MGYFWAAIVSIILILIIYGIVSSKLRKHKMRTMTEAMLPKLKDHIQANHRYNIFLSHGKTLKNAKFLGLATPYDEQSQFLPFPLQQWLIVEKEDGKRAYLKPESVRFYEDAEL